MYELSPPEYGDGPLRADRDFIRAATWLKEPASSPQALMLGAPFSGLSLSGARCDLLPDAVRRALWTFSTFSGSVDLRSFPVSDLGSVIVDAGDADESLRRIKKVCESLPKVPLVVIGGDNSITAPAMMGTVGAGGGLITIDAHHDLRNYQRDGISNGSPVRVLLDEGVDPGHVWQIGIAGFVNSLSYSEYAAQRGIRVVGVSDVKRYGIRTHLENALAELHAADGIYIDIDVDSVERALAPGAPAAQPGGLMPEDLTTAAFICGLDPNVMALDIVEVDPSRDVADSTVRLAALILLNFLAGVASRGSE